MSIKNNNDYILILYRYCICQKVWSAWKEYVILEKIKAAKESVAIVHGKYLI